MFKLSWKGIHCGSNAQTKKNAGHGNHLNSQHEKLLSLKTIIYCKKLENSSWSCGNSTETIGNREPIRNCWKHMMIHQFFLDSIRSTHKAWVPPSRGNSILGGLKERCAVVCCSLIVHYTRYEIEKCEMLYNHVSHHFVIFFDYMVVSIQNILESRISGWCFMFVYESAKTVNFKNCGRLT